MKISIFGMGYVGVVSVGCLARDGHDVTGIDPVSSKIDDLRNGRAPIQEPQVAAMIEAAHRSGRLRATVDPQGGLAGCEMAWICVGTPCGADGSVNLSAVSAAAGQIGDYVRTVTGSAPTVVLRSTVPPGTTRGRLGPLLAQRSGRALGPDLPLVFHPEFLREGNAVEDFDHPPKIVVGENTAGAADKLLQLYAASTAPIFRLSVEEAELVKYCDNLFHATKITFANEVGAIAKAVGVDARRVADVFCADTKLNISPRYLRPGFAFGGSCLTKDLRAILREAALRSVALPMLAGVAESNSRQIEAFVGRVLAHRPNRVGLVGLAFKPGTDDMRESPYVIVAKRLLGEGLTLRIFDPGVHPDRLIGSNRTMVLAALGHLEQLLVRSVDDLAICDLLIVNHPIVDAKIVRDWLTRKKRVMDLASVPGMDRQSAGYEGIAW